MTTSTRSRKVLTAAGQTIAEALPFWQTSLRAANRAPATVKLYADEVRNLHRWLAEQGMPTDVGLVRREHIEAWIVSLQARLSEASVSMSYRSIRPFWAWLVEDDEIDKTPMEGMKPPKVHVEAPAFPSTVSLEALLATCAGRTFEERRDRAIILLLVDTGIRRGELVNLRLADVDAKEDKLKVIGKARFHRQVALNPIVAQAVQRYIRVRSVHPHAEAPALWLGRKGELTGSAVLQMLRRRGDLIGMPKLHPHAFRHAFAHSALESGMSESDLMRIAGWRDPSMVRRYGAALAEQRALTAHAVHSPAAKLKLGK